MPARFSNPLPYFPDAEPILPDTTGRYQSAQFQRISQSIASILPLTPQVATAAPKSPIDGMIRLARAPWRPVAGTTTDAWVFYDAPSTSWKLLHAN